MALTLGSILLIASTACATIVFNAILAPIFLKEKFKIFPDGCTVVLLSIGSTLAAFQEPQKVPHLTQQAMKAKIYSPRTLSYLCGLIIVGCLRYHYLKFLKKAL